MRNYGARMGWVVVMGVALLVAFAIVPGLSGVSSASPAASATTPAPALAPWAYGGQGWSNNTLTFGNTTSASNASVLPVA